MAIAEVLWEERASEWSESFPNRDPGGRSCESVSTSSTANRRQKAGLAQPLKELERVIRTEPLRFRDSGEGLGRQVGSVRHAEQAAQAVLFLRGDLHRREE